MSHNKLARQAKIKEIISNREISSQEDLCRFLEKSGFETTQATLSRDLHELGIVRIPSETGFKYVFHLEDNDGALKQLIGMEIINVLHNESAVIIKTMPGRAAGVAVYLDRMKDSHIIGTVAGDDSIIVIPDSHKNVTKLVNKIKNLSQDH
jgi:transcriptional regulator of arginine metabolism